jgi:hypothetical protein
MSFLNPGLFAVLAPLLALPLFIHLFNRRFPRTIPFPDIERLKKSLAERSKLARWRHMIMTVLRTLIIACTLLAFLKPVLPRFGSDAGTAGKQGGRRVLLIVDRSLSMEQNEGGTPASRNAVIEAGKILATLGVADSSNAVLAGVQPSPLLPAFTHAHDEIRSGLAALPMSWERADISKALALAISMLGSDPSGAEIFFLSDFQRANWADVAFDGLPKGVRLFFTDAAGNAERRNTALLKVTAVTAASAAREVIRLEVLAGNYTPDAATLPVEAIIDGRQSVAGEIRAAAWSTGRATLDLPAPGEGIHSLEVRLPDDGLPADNHRWLCLQGRGRENVLVLCDANDTASGARFVQTALDPFETGAGAFAVQRTTTAAVTPAQLASASRIVLTGARALEPDLVARLNGFLERGGGLVYFCDAKNDRENLAALDQAAGRPYMPFQLAGQLTTENFGGEPQRILQGKFESPLLRLFRGTNRQALAVLEFYAIQRALPTGQGEVLLTFADGTPAMGTAVTGLGTAVICNFAPAELASNLARQRLFPAWMQDLMKGLSAETAPEGGRETGSLMTAEVWTKDLNSQSVSGPDGHPVAAKTTVDGERTTAVFTAMQPGIYAVRAGGRLVWADAASVSAAESDLRSIDTAELLRRAETSPVNGAHAVSGADDYRELHTGRPVYHWFLVGAAVLLLGEMLLFRPLQRSSGRPA